MRPFALFRTSKGLGQSSSPRLVERKRSGIAKKLSMDSSVLSSSRLPLPPNITVFILPGVDVKVILFTCFFVLPLVGDTDNGHHVVDGN
jgi:hypothetical protein